MHLKLRVVSISSSIKLKCPLFYFVAIMYKKLRIIDVAWQEISEKVIKSIADKCQNSLTRTTVENLYFLQVTSISCLVCLKKNKTNAIIINEDYLPLCCILQCLLILYCYVRSLLSVGFNEMQFSSSLDRSPHLCKTLATVNTIFFVPWLSAVALQCCLNFSVYICFGL